MEWWKQNEQLHKAVQLELQMSRQFSEITQFVFVQQEQVADAIARLQSHRVQITRVQLDIDGDIASYSTTQLRLSVQLD